MGQRTTIHQKAKRLLDLHGYNQKQLAKLSDTTYSAIHDFFNNDRNVTLKLFQKIAKPLGVNLDDILNDRIEQMLEREPKNLPQNQDLAKLIDGLDKIQRKTLIKTAINFYKSNNQIQSNELIERIEKRQL